MSYGVVVILSCRIPHVRNAAYMPPTHMKNESMLGCDCDGELGARGAARFGVRSFSVLPLRWPLPCVVLASGAFAMLSILIISPESMRGSGDNCLRRGISLSFLYTKGVTMCKSTRIGCLWMTQVRLNSQGDLASSDQCVSGAGCPDRPLE